MPINVWPFNASPRAITMAMSAVNGQRQETPAPLSLTPVVDRTTAVVASSRSIVTPFTDLGDDAAVIADAATGAGLRLIVGRAESAGAETASKP
jgi:hypothetical protein